jgi:hypothetical protein
MSGSQYLNLKNQGLYTFSNPLNASVVPEGSFASVSNVVIDRNEIIEPRRGFAQYGNSFGNSLDRAKQLINYKDTIIRHVLDQLQYDVNGTFSTFTGPSINDTGFRLKSIEANGNLYFVSATGVKKLAARSSSDFSSLSIIESGGVKALDLNAKANYTSSGFLTPNSNVAYRIVWGYKDINNNLILGAPSSRIVVFNPSLTDSSIVDLSFDIPNSIQSSKFFYQVYRTGVFQGAVPPEVVKAESPADPGDEMYLVFEDNVTSAQLIARKIQIQDITPEAFRKNGTLLYTNPTSGGGIESANNIPPYATDIALYKNYTFYANTKTVQRLNLAFLSVAAMISNSSTITISDGTISNIYTFQGSVESYSVNFNGTSPTDYYNATSGPAKYFTLNSSSDERSYYVWFQQDALNDLDPALSGKLGIKVLILSTDNLSQIINKVISTIGLASIDFNISRVGNTLNIDCANNGQVIISPTTNITSSFTISKNGAGTGQDAANNKVFLPRVPTGIQNGPTTSQQLEQVARSLVSVLNLQDTVAYAYYTSGSNDVPGQILLEQQATTGKAFYITSTVGQEFNPTLPSTGNGVISSNEVSPNRLYFSKAQQPEAVPLANYIDIGPKDREIKRIIALRESLFILKEDGIYRLSGNTSGNFIVNPFDFSAQVLAPDTAVVLNNQIYALSTQGVIQITDTGTRVMSRPIENSLLNITRQNFNFKTASFSVAYETDRAFMLFTVSSVNDTVATQCFRYNTFTSTWTRWDITKNCGIVDFATDTLYLGAGDTNIIEKERKSLNRRDHADRQYNLEVLLNGVNNGALSLNSVAQVTPGDVLIQTQYLTGSQFNRILDKLDRDISVGDKNYKSLDISSGQNLRSKLIDLATKLDLDPGIVYNSFVSDINSYTYNISSKTIVGSQTILTTSVPHLIKATRYINVSGVGILLVTAVTNNTLTVNTVIANTPANVQTAVNDFRDMQACFNIIVNTLNLDTGVFFSNYPLSTFSIDFEVAILSADKTSNTVQIKVNDFFLFGTVTLYKAIHSSVVWNPVYMQDPSIMKQIRESTMIFENANFSKVDISYSSDLSPSFENITFEGAGLGVGDWGYFSFGTINWGGVAAPIPLRTLIPLSKQRCRFLNVKFDHSVAFEKYAIYGISLTYRPVSNRAYR